MVNGTVQPGVVAVADDIDIFRNTEPGQMMTQQRQESRAFNNAATDEYHLRIEHINEVIKTRAEVVKKLSD